MKDFYTQEQIKRILAYAKERHIKVVPEIEMPGHASLLLLLIPGWGRQMRKSRFRFVSGNFIRCTM